MELVDAAQAIGLYYGRSFDADENSDHWTPIEVMKVSRRGRSNFVTSVYLEAADREQNRFRFDSDTALVKAGDVIMRRHHHVSLFDADSMTTLTFEVVELRQTRTG